MTAYADTISRPARTLTESEQRLLLKFTGQRLDGFRDHVIVAPAIPRYIDGDLAPRDRSRVQDALFEAHELGHVFWRKYFVVPLADDCLQVKSRMGIVNPDIAQFAIQGSHDNWKVLGRQPEIRLDLAQRCFCFLLCGYILQGAHQDASMGLADG